MAQRGRPPAYKGKFSAEALKQSIISTLENDHTHKDHEDFQKSLELQAGKAAEYWFEKLVTSLRALIVPADSDKLVKLAICKAIDETDITVRLDLDGF